MRPVAPSSPAVIVGVAVAIIAVPVSGFVGEYASELAVRGQCFALGFFFLLRFGVEALEEVPDDEVGYYRLYRLSVWQVQCEPGQVHTAAAAMRMSGREPMRVLFLLELIVPVLLVQRPAREVRRVKKCGRGGGSRDSRMRCLLSAVSLRSQAVARRRRHSTPATLHLGLPLCSLGSEPPLQASVGLQPSHTTTRDKMAVIYKPTEVIQLLRPAAKRPLSIPRKRAVRVAFSTARPAQAAQSSSSSPPPQPTRRQVTVTNDTGAVRWNELSPAEKASRTVQQSFNLSIVLVGIVMTVPSLRLLYS